jgi:nicotinate-nucleotide adenylyltransferase
VTSIGLLGGTFDPPHLGHLVMTEMVRDALGLDEVRLLVAGDPWMKAGESPALHRIAMARLAAATLDGVVVDDRETRRDGPTYTVDTLLELTAGAPDTRWYFLLGRDAAAGLPSWHRVEEAMAMATFVLVDREAAGDVPPEFKQRLLEVDTPRIGISSTDVRARVAAGRSIRTLVPDPVRAYIHDHGLYRHADE